MARLGPDPLPPPPCPSQVRVSGRILRSCARAYVWVRLAARPIYYTKFPPRGARSVPANPCRIPERGRRRVNISSHVKPRAGKNVSTWVPWLVLAAPFAPFFPGPPLLSLSIYLPPEGGSLHGADRRKGRAPAKEEEEHARTRWMDPARFSPPSFFFLRRIKVANADRAVPTWSYLDQWLGLTCATIAELRVPFGVPLSGAWMLALGHRVQGNGIASGWYGSGHSECCRIWEYSEMIVLMAILLRWLLLL